MISKREGAIKIILALIILVSITHSISHFILFKTNLSLIKTVGLSGRVIGDTNIDNIETNIKQNNKIKIPSMVIIAGEWIFLFSLIALLVVKKHITEKVQKTAHIELLSKRNKSETDIDVLYEMLKKNKKIPLSKLAELFKVNKKVVEEWGTILEESGYAIVDYPRFGEIEIILKEEAIPKEEEEKYKKRVIEKKDKKVGEDEKTHKA